VSSGRKRWRRNSSRSTRLRRNRRRSRWNRRGGRSHPCRFGRRFLRDLFRSGARFFGSLFFRQLVKMCPDRDRRGHVDGARVSLLFLDSRFGQKINDGLGLDLQLAGKLINSDLFDVTHSCARLFLSLRFRGCIGMLRAGSGFRRRFDSRLFFACRGSGIARFLWLSFRLRFDSALRDRSLA